MLFTTSYRMHLSKILNDYKAIYEQRNITGKEAKLLLHQYICMKYFSERKPRGLLLFHKMGTGKTFAGVSLCESVIDQCKGIIFIARLSVHENFRSTIEKYAGVVSDKYKFVSLGSSNMKKVILGHVVENLAVDIDENRIDADGFLFIVDEAHNLFSSITNGSENAVFLYKLIMRSKCRVIFMTGSVALKEAYEIGIAFNMLAGYLEGNQTLFGESYEHFSEYFIQDVSVLDNESQSFKTDTKNMDVFGDRITGLASFYQPPPSVEKEHFPEMFGPYVIRCKMSLKQYDIYKFYRARERREESGSSRKQASGLAIPKGSKGTYRVMSRQTSNYIYPEHASSKVYNAKGDLSYQHNFSALLPDDFLEESLKTLSPKLLALMRRIKLHCKPEFLIDITELPEKKRPKKTRISPGIIYSQYLDYGLNIIAACLDAHGYNKFDGVRRNALSYAVISGEVSQEEQTEIVKAMNDPQNIDGSILHLLLISATGSEGLDIKRLGHVHIYEPHWHDSRHKQVAARANRYDGAIDLPPEDRNFCVYVYLSDYPPDTTSDEATTDITLYRKALARQHIIDRFLSTLKINAVDCVIHNNKDLCRICSPTDESLIINALDKHIEYGSRCIVNKTEEVAAYPFEYDGKEYYCYRKGRDVIVIYYSTVYGEFIELNPSDKDYYNIIAKATAILLEMQSS